MTLSSWIYNKYDSISTSSESYSTYLPEYLSKENKYDKMQNVQENSIKTEIARIEKWAWWNGPFIFNSIEALNTMKEKDWYILITYSISTL